MTVAAIIPARMAATRFPGKPLIPIMGLPMIEHVRRRVALCEDLDEVIVATCDKEIKITVEGYGGKVVMTADTHERCTDRVAEAAKIIKADIYINVQGDEPLVLPEMMHDAVKPFESENDLPCVNLVTPITDMKEFENPNAIKVVTDRENNALYMSREPIPSRTKYDSLSFPKIKQLGVIAFRSDFLQCFSKLPQTPLEAVESIDMLRAIEHGHVVKTVMTKGRMIGVDLPEDVERVEEILSKDKLLERYL